MPGRMEVGEADGEWSDASEDAVKSGSATDASRGDADETSAKQLSKSSLLSFSPSSFSRKDPVHSILDKIDAELAAMAGPDTQASTILGRTSTTCKPRSSLPPLLPVRNSQDGDLKKKGGSGHGLTNGTATESEQQKIAGSAEIYTDAALTDVPTDDDAATAQQATDDFLSDLDSVVAQQIDSRFKEIMLRKKVNQSPPAILPKPILTNFSQSTHLETPTATTLLPPPPPPSAPQPLRPFSTGYGTDNDSIKTEDFEQRFQTLIVMTDGNTSGESARKPRNRRWKHSNNGSAGHTSAKKTGAGNGPGGRARNTSSAVNGAAGGRVSFDDTPKDKNEEKTESVSSTFLLNGLSRVLHHPMKSLGEETTLKEPAGSPPRVASLPPSGRSRSVSPERLSIHHPRIDYSHHGLSDHHLGRHLPLRQPPPWSQQPWSNDSKGQSQGTGSSRSTFEEVESLCLSKSSSDSSFGQFRNQQRHGLGNSSVTPASGQNPNQLLGGRFLSRQSSTTSTSTSSGNLAEHLERRSGSTSTSGSVYEDNMETLDPRQQFDLNDHALLDGIFRRVLEWNNAHASMSMGRGGPGGGGIPSGVPFPQVPPGPFPQAPLGAYLQGAFPQVPSASVPPPPSPPGIGDPNPYTRPVPASGRRVADSAKDKLHSPTSDITHVKRRRDLIIPDDEDEFSFTRPYSRKPETKSPSDKNSKTSSSGGTPSFSSKQASSDSMLSSMSSMSQSQDLSWREQFYQGFREMQHAALQDQANRGWGDHYAYPWRGADHSQQMWRDHPPPAHPPPAMMMMPPGYQMSTPRLSRGMSMESMNSFGMTSPPDSCVNPYMSTTQMQNPAERMLMNLGFGGAAEGFLPERFLRDWYSKLSRTQSQFPANQFRPPDNSTASLYGSASNLHSPQQTKVTLQSKPSYEDLRSASDLHRRIGHPLNRAATVSASQPNDPPETPTSLLPPSLGKESRTDRLKEYIEAYAQNMSNTTDARSLRISQFASSRQKSLPSYLETLTEEDEVKTRNPGYKPQDRESHLQAFLREDSFSTKSDSHGTSSNGASVEQSLCGSESDSLSGSDHYNSTQRTRQALFTSREPLSSFTMSQPAPVTSRKLTLKMPNSVSSRSEQQNPNTRTNDNEAIPGTPKKSHRHGHSSRHNSPEHSPGRGYRQNSPRKSPHRRPGNAQNGQNQSNGENSPKLKSPSHRPRTPNKEHKMKYPSHRAKSPSHRSRSPRHHRAKSPGKEFNTMSVDESEMLRFKARSSSLDDSSSSSGSHRKKASSVDPNKLFVSQSPLGSPIRRHSTSLANHVTAGQSGNFLTVNAGPVPFGLQQENTGNFTPNLINTVEQKTDPLVSTESLEVADILQNPSASNSKNSRTNKENSPRKSSIGVGEHGQLEPAMISIVLEDVDGNLMEKGDSLEGDDGCQQQLCHQQNGDSGHQDELLHIPSRSSSLSLSPIPQSPVTVIEVSLDNQQDSIDTEEGTNSSKDLNDEEEMSGMDSDAVPTVVDFLSDDTDPSEFPGFINPGGKRNLSSAVPLSETGSSEELNMDVRMMCDAYVEADDGSTSPILFFSASSPVTSCSSSSSVTTPSSNLSEIGIQADDGRLSPLVLLNYTATVSGFVQNDTAEELYLVSDQAAQCDNVNLSEQAQTQMTLKEGQKTEPYFLEMADRFTQTNRLVKYEMSSQTEFSLQSLYPNIRSAVPFESRVQTKHFTNLQSMPNYLRALEFQATNHTQVVDSGLISRQNVSPLSYLSTSSPTGIHSPVKTCKNSFDAEFWDYLGIEVPMKLRKTHLLPVPKNKQVQASSSRDSAVIHTVHTQRRRSPLTVVRSPSLDSVQSVLSDSYEVVRSLSPEQLKSPSSSLGSPGFYSRPRLTSSPSPTRHSGPSRSPVQLPSPGTGHLQASPVQSPVASSTPRHRFHNSVQLPNHDTAHNLGFTEHKGVNTSVTMAVTEPEKNSDSVVIEESRCFYVKPLLLDFALPQHDREIEQRNGLQVYVSLLNFKVEDYRDAEISAHNSTTNTQISDANPEKCSIPDGKLPDSVTEQNYPNVPSLKQNLLMVPERMRADLPDLQSNDVEHQTRTEHQLDTRELPIDVENAQQRPCDLVCNYSSSPDSSADSVTPSAHISQNHQNSQTSVRKGSKFSQFERGKSIDDFSDKDFSSMEEAREFVLTRFLLRGSKDSDSKQSGSSVQTVVDVKDSDKRLSNPVVPKQNGVGSPDKKDICNHPSGAKDFFFLRETSNVDNKSFKSDDSPAGGEYVTIENTEKGPVLSVTEVQESLDANADRETLGRTAFTGTDAMKNLAYDCFLLRPRASSEQVSTSSTENKNKSSNEKAHESDKNVSTDSEEVFKEQERITKGGSSITASTTEKSSVTLKRKLDARRDWLLETFAHSVVESACHDLQRNYLENKERLQKRVRKELKLTGVFTTENASENQLTKAVEAEKSSDSVSETETNNVTCDKHERRSGNAETESSESGNESAGYKHVHINRDTSSVMCSDSDDAIFEISQDSTSDGSSELSVIFAGSLPLVTSEKLGGKKKETSSDASCDEMKIPIDLPQPVFLETKEHKLVPHKHLISPTPVYIDGENDMEGRSLRSMSADSMNSLHVNCSGSVEDIIDSIESDQETYFLQKHSDHEDDTQDVLMPSAQVSACINDENVPEENKTKSTQVEIHDHSHINTSVDENTDRTLQAAVVAGSKRTLSRDQNPSGESSDAPSDCTSSSSNISEPLTDAKLTQLILLSVNHPELQRLRVQGILLDSFDSSPNFTTPENEVSSDIEDHEVQDCSVKSSVFSDSQDISFLLDSDIFQNAFIGRRFGGYLSNISEEDSSFDKVVEQAVETLKSSLEDDTSGTREGTADTKSEACEKQSYRIASPELTSEQVEFGIDVSIQPLPDDFNPGAMLIELPVKVAIATEHSVNETDPEFETAFPFDVEYNELESAQHFIHAEDAASIVSSLHEDKEDFKSSVLFTDNDSHEKNERNQEISEMYPVDSYSETDDEGLQGREHHASEILETLSSILSIEYFRSGTELVAKPNSATAQPTSTEHDEVTSLNDSLVASKARIRSELHLSLHPLQEEAKDVEKPRLLSAAEKREAYNRLTADRSGMGLSSSFSEENLSSPPLRPRRFQRSLSKESNSSDLSPKRVKRAVSRGSPNFDAGSCWTGNSLSVPYTGESLVSKTALSRRSRSPPDLDRSRLPRCQSPIPDSNAPLRSHSPIFGQSSSPTFSRPFPDLLPPSGSLSPIFNPPASPRGPSPIPDVTISSVNQSVEFVSFTSSPDSSPGRGSQPGDSASTCKTTTDTKKHRRSPRSRFSANSETNVSERRSPSPRAHDETPVSVSGKEPRSVSTDRSPILSRFRALQKTDPVSSPDGSPKLPSPFTVRTFSSTGDESMPLQFSISRTFFSTTHIPTPQPRARLRSIGDMNSNSSTESPMPSTPPLSRDQSTSSSDSSPSLKDAQLASLSENLVSVLDSSQSFSPEKTPATDVTTATFKTVSPKAGSDAKEPKSNNAGDAEEIPGKNATAERELTEPVLSNTSLPPNSASAAAESAAPTASSKPDPVAALHLRRSRFQKPGSTFSLQQNSSSSDQSSSETGASPRRRFYWSSGQRTVVSLTGERSSSKDSGSPARSWKTDYGAAGAQNPEGTWKPWMPKKMVNSFRDSSSTTSDQGSSDNITSPVKSQLSGRGASDQMQTGSSLESERPSAGQQSSFFRESVSPKAELVSLNGLKTEPSNRSVRELARQFEERTTK